MIHLDKQSEVEGATYLEVDAGQQLRGCAGERPGQPVCRGEPGIARHVQHSDATPNISEHTAVVVGCGKDAGDCGRVPLSGQPGAAADQELATKLWEGTEAAIGSDRLQPLKAKSKKRARG